MACLEEGRASLSQVVAVCGEVEEEVVLEGLLFWVRKGVITESLAALAVDCSGREAERHFEVVEAQAAACEDCSPPAGGFDDVKVGRSLFSTLVVMSWTATEFANERCCGRSAQINFWCS